MLFWLAAASALAVNSAPMPAHSSADLRPASAEARATVRIVSGVRLKLGPAQVQQEQSEGVPPPHNSVVMADGTLKPAKLIEFE